LRESDGTIVTFDAPGAGTGFNEGTVPLGITPGGDIMGLFIDSSGVTHGFILNPDISNFGLVDATTLNVTVPESSTWAMMIIGFAGFGFAGYWRMRIVERPTSANISVRLRKHSAALSSSRKSRARVVPFFMSVVR
jgi:hypothetical protein